MTATNSPLVTPAVRPAGVPAGFLKSRLATVGLMVVVGIGLLVLAYVANRPAGSTTGGVTTVDLGGIPRGAAPIVGQPAPDLIDAVTADGGALSLASFKGSPIWLTFGATWCQPCRAEAADIEGAYEAFKDRGVVVIEVFMTNDRETILDYAGRVGLTFVKVPDPSSQLATDYRVLGIPTHYFIDRAGNISAMKVGTLDRQSMDDILGGLAD